MRGASPPPRSSSKKRVAPAELALEASERGTAAALTAVSETLLSGWTPRSGRLGVYMHLPFCAKRCGYCSFNTAPYAPGAMDRFLAALGAEIDLAAKAPWAASTTIASVFVGGGTPSLATDEEMAVVLDRLRERFRVDAAEVTVECNPESVSRQRLAGYRRAGATA